MAFRQNWLEEKQSAWLYQTLANVEADSRKVTLFRSMAAAAEDQARLWEVKMREQGTQATPVFVPSPRARLVAWLVRRLGVRPMRGVLAAMKVRGMSVYAARPLNPAHPMPRTVEDVGRRHRGVDSGGNLRAAVFGVNDGLVSNTSLIMGVAGGSSDPDVVLLAGIAGLLAGALSMAAGEYVSMRSQRELFEYQIRLERDELEEYPAEETAELALIYGARGVDQETARAVAQEIMQDPARALDALAREELGLNPDELGSPMGAALSSLGAFSLGALLPLLPFVLGNPAEALYLAATLAALGLFAVGSAISLFTGTSALMGGLRMLLIGGGAGVVTYLIGTLLGAGLT